MTVSIRTLSTVACLGIAAFAAPKRLEAGERVPDITVEGLDGTDLRLAPAEGEEATVSIIVFVDPDQEASRRVLADLAKIREAIGDDQPSMRWIAVASGKLADTESTALRDAAKARSFVEFGLDPGRDAYAQFGVIAVPTTFVVGTDGIVAAAFPGRSASFRGRLEKALRTARGEEISEEEDAVPETAEEKRARRLIAAAHNLISRRRHEEAAALLTEAGELRPDDAELVVLLGDTYLDLERGEDALRAFDRALELQPKLRSAQNGRACALAFGEDLEVAEKALRKALRKPPQMPRLFYFLGRVLERGGDAAGAAAAYREAYERLHAAQE